MVVEPGLAWALNNLSVRRSKLGRHEDAMTASEEAVALYRRLAKANPGAFESDLAWALDSFADVRTEGRKDLDRAESAIREAIGIFERLKDAMPEGSADDTSIAYRTAVRLLDSMGREDEAAALRHRIDVSNGSGLKEMPEATL